MPTESSSLAQDKNKLTYLLKVASAVISLTALGWVIFFTVIQDWVAVFTELILVTLGVLAFFATKRNNTKIIARIYLPLFFFVMCFICACFDVPNATIPRSNNNYFLPMALYAYVLYQDEPPYLKIAFPIIMVLAFLLFACTDIGVDLASMTNAQRMVRVWITNSVAVVMLSLATLIMQSDFKVRHTLELELSNALLKNELLLYYQPQVDSNGRTIGAEALARWRHPHLGYIGPNIFIPLAEKTDLILHLGKHMLVSACHQLASWAQTDATAHLTLSVNISTKQFQSSDFVQHIVTLINETNIEARKLQLEITESVFAYNLEEVKIKMSQLKTYGIKLSLDDFGTGYSSLTYVKNLPLDELKIDKSFVKDVLSNDKSASITKMIISLAHELGIAIIAEGVETKEQKQFLIENGCLNFQGYLFSAAIPINEFNNFVLDKNRA